MAMFRYNPKLGKNLESTDSRWTAEIGEGSLEGKLVVIYEKNTGKETKYIVDGFKNKTEYEFDKEDLWYSFDYENDNYNFHIVPGNSLKIKAKCGGKKEISLYHKLDSIKKKVEIEKNKKIPGITVEEKVKRGGGKDGCTTNHKWICAKSEKNEFLMSFNRLWCDVKADGNHIHNNFGQAQFMCYPIKRAGTNIVGDINLVDGKFQLMYPSSDEDGIYYGKAKHLVYNAPYDINDSAEAIAKAFAGFIELCEGMRNEETA